LQHVISFVLCLTMLHSRRGVSCLAVAHNCAGVLSLLLSALMVGAHGFVRGVQAELEAANTTWSLTDYSHTTHAFTLPSNALWTSGPVRT